MPYPLDRTSSSGSKHDTPTDGSRSGLCNLCDAIDIAPLIAKLLAYERRTIEHQPSFSALQSSSDRGCGLCRLFLASLFKDDQQLDQTAGARPPLLTRTSTGFTSHSSSGLVIDVAAYHREVDAQPGSPKFMIEIQAESTLDTDFAIQYTIRYKRQAARHAFGEVPVPRPLLLSTEYGTELGIQNRLIAEFPLFSLYSGWLEACIHGNRHIRCQPIEPVPLPSRLVDVGSGAGTNTPKLITSDGQEGYYLTLSHCWGETRPLVTTSKNIVQHRIGIPYAALPKLFQDALLVTRILGYQYIWIDSLCIIQDDASDWERECARMGDIFRLSACTIAAPAAAGSEHSFLSLRKRPVVDPCRLPIVQGGASSSHVAIEFPPPSIKENTSALSTRAWVLQEQLLSPRTLYFGARGMYFQCHSHEYLETYASPLPPERVTSWRTDEAGDLPKTLLGMAAKDVLYWYSIVRQYSFRRLTYGEDKLPALSGLASLLSSSSSENGKSFGTYLVGLWESDIARGLLWTSDAKASASSDQAEPPLHYVDELAPSWSWASQNQPVEWRILSNFHPACTLLSHSLSPSTAHLFGRVDHASLTLQGPTRSATLQRRPTGVVLCGLVDFREIAELSLDATASVYLDGHWVMADPTFTVRLLKLGFAENTLYGTRWYALLLAPGYEEEGWRRLGLAASLIAGAEGPRSVSVEGSLGLFEGGRDEEVVVV